MTSGRKAEQASLGDIRRAPRGLLLCGFGETRNFYGGFLMYLLLFLLLVHV